MKHMLRQREKSSTGDRRTWVLVSGCTEMLASSMLTDQPQQSCRDHSTPSSWQEQSDLLIQLNVDNGRYSQRAVCTWSTGLRGYKILVFQVKIYHLKYQTTADPLQCINQVLTGFLELNSWLYPINYPDYTNAQCGSEIMTFAVLPKP